VGCSSGSAKPSLAIRAQASTSARSSPFRKFSASWAESAGFLFSRLFEQRRPYAAEIRGRVLRELGIRELAEYQARVASDRSR
jgi:hypothetical protein